MGVFALLKTMSICQLFSASEWFALQSDSDHGQTGGQKRNVHYTMFPYARHHNAVFYIYFKPDFEK